MSYHLAFHSLQGFIHPFLARVFWVAGNNRPNFGSPYRFCNGSHILDFDHSFTFTRDSDLGSYVFIDFAGSGLVHLCGKSVVSFVVKEVLSFNIILLPSPFPQVAWVPLLWL